MKRGYILNKGVIEIDRELTELDEFVQDFLNVIKNHSDYLIVSGFVSISTGRTRGTEDIDILIPIMPYEKFKKLFESLKNAGFWCYQGDSADEIYDYFKNKDNVRFARKNEMFPNMEVIPIDESRKAKFFEFSHPQRIKVDNFEFKIPPIEFEILYKEIILKGKKDVDDANHLREFFSEILNEDKFKEFKKIIINDKK